MLKGYRFLILATVLVGLYLCFFRAGSNTVSVVDEAQLGERLFHDVDLSRDGGQSCSSCHNPQFAFADPRYNESSASLHLPGAVSKGQDEIVFGDINAPSIAYAGLIPPFHYDDSEQVFVGGLFLNGRAGDLKEQATGPILNHVEMQNSPDKLAQTIRKKYSDEFTFLYGRQSLKSPESILDALAKAIVAFERSDAFARFDSKFDRVLSGKESFTELEAFGLELFKDEQKGNCAACHPVPEINSSKQQSLFTDFTYDNLGAPANRLVRGLNGSQSDYVDKGLLNNPSVDDESVAGAFRVPSLRNVAVTAPYLHNGVFQTLNEVLHFYNTRDVEGAVNPRTQKPWQKPEVAKTMNSEELGDLQLTEKELQAIEAFLKTLTDRRYESLLSEPPTSRD